MFFVSATHINDIRVHKERCGDVEDTYVARDKFCYQSSGAALREI